MPRPGSGRRSSAPFSAGAPSRNPLLPVAGDAQAFIDALTDWFDGSARNLPWRGSPHAGDPYAVLVSEVMLQQTRVDTVVPYFERWMTRWPTLRDLAAAQEQDVLDAWAGLGYYSRARRLLAAARAVVAQHGGVLPANPAALRALPGLGPYATGAVASLAFDVPLPAVDGNVARVVARLNGLDVDVRETGVRRQIHDELGPLLPRRGAGRFNEALIELGATVCTPRDPQCSRCPAKPWCDASRTGRAEAIPVTGPRRKPTRQSVAAFLLPLEDGRVLLRRRPNQGLLAGLWGLPMEVLVPGEAISAAASRAIQKEDLQVGPRVASVRHVFSHRIWDVRVYAVTQPAEQDHPTLGADWAALGDPGLALSTLDRKLVRAAGAAGLV